MKFSSLKHCLIIHDFYTNTYIGAFVKISFMLIRSVCDNFKALIDLIYLRME